MVNWTLSFILSRDLAFSLLSFSEHKMQVQQLRAGWAVALDVCVHCTSARGSGSAESALPGCQPSRSPAKADKAQWGIALFSQASLPERTLVQGDNCGDNCAHYSPSFSSSHWCWHTNYKKSPRYLESLLPFRVATFPQRIILQMNLHMLTCQRILIRNTEN